MIALGQGASQSVQARLAGLGTNLLSILPASFGGPNGVQIGVGAASSQRCTSQRTARFSAEASWSFMSSRAAFERLQPSGASMPGRARG